jgi:hypothetical protein
MSDEPQEQPQENYQSLKNEIKNELKEEFSHFRQKRKHRVLYSAGIFILGLVIGFGGGVVSHSEHHPGYGHFQKMHHMRK